MTASLDATHDASRRSFVARANADDCDFPLQNLPFGIFSIGSGSARGGVAIGDCIFDLAAASASGLFEGLAAEAAANVPGAFAYTYAARDPLAARILVVEEGGLAFPRGSDIGAPEEIITGKWSGILDGAGFEPGMYSWWTIVAVGSLLSRMYAISPALSR